MLDATTLAGALDGVGIAYYLVHSMGRGGGATSPSATAAAAANFADAARAAGSGG